MSGVSGDLFNALEPHWQPLPELLRPRQLSDVVGQSHLVAPGQPLHQAVARGQLHSMILWGPPGVGKTTLAKVLSQSLQARFEQLSAVTAGVKELRSVFEEAQMRQRHQQQLTVLFIDEIHRFSKSQQDVVLPFVEDGTVILIGATTENPSFSLNNALLSRAMVYHLTSLTPEELETLLHKGLSTLTEQGRVEPEKGLTPEQISRVAELADGDARRALNFLERVVEWLEAHEASTLTNEQLASVCMQQPQRYDNQGDIYYDQISAFHKSVRGSSPDGALYWFARMLVAGADPLYVARRLLAIASEDIGNADPRALEVVINAWDAFERLGPTEGNRAIAHAAVYCASAPKSNAVEVAFKKAMAVAKASNSLPVPYHLCNAPTKLLKEMGKGEGYRYAHDEPHAYSPGQTYLPEEVQAQRFYEPTSRGLEQKIADRLARLRQMDEQA